MQKAVRKHSRKRDALLAILRETKRHPTAAWVHEALRRVYPDVSLGTVYRNLAEFKADGLVRSVGFVNGFERFDADTSPHDHFICTECGAVLDVFTDTRTELSALRHRTGLDIRRADTSYYGVCPDCARKNEGPGENKE